MAVNIGQELTAISFMQEKSAGANGQQIFDVERLGMFVKTAEAYERELKRVLGEVITTKNEIDKVTGQMSRTLYIPRERLSEAQGVLKGVEATRSTYFKDKDYMYYTAQDAHMLEVTREIKGAKAQAYAKEELVDIGGIVKRTPNTANKDMMTSYIPVLDDDLNSMSPKDRASYLRSLTPKSNKASVAEQRDRTIKEQERIREQEITDKARVKKLTDHENARKTREQERQWESERKEEEKEAKESEKEQKHSRKVLLGKVGFLVTALGTLVDISRRILVSVLDFSSKVSKDTTKGRTLEIGYSDMRNFNYLDKALGLDEGTNIQAQEDFRAKFGNTAKLDTEALKWLAMVMGEDVGAMVQSGLGGDNPAQLVEATIDAFFKRWQSGQDQYGNQVGQEKSRRALVTLLESVSPSVARIFERMVEEYTHGLHAGGFDTYRGMQSFYIPATGGLSSNDWEQISLVGKQADDLRTQFENLGKVIEGSFTKSLNKVIDWIDSKVIGGTAQEKFNKIQQIRKELEGQKVSTQEAINKRAQVFAPMLSELGIDPNSPEAMSQFFEMVSADPYTHNIGETDEEYNLRRSRRLKARQYYRQLTGDTQGMGDLMLYLGDLEAMRIIRKELSEDEPETRSSELSPSGRIELGWNKLRAYNPSVENKHFSFTEESFTSEFLQKYKASGYSSLYAYLKEVGFKRSDLLPEYIPDYEQSAIGFFTEALKHTKDSKNSDWGGAWRSLLDIAEAKTFPTFGNHDLTEELIREALLALEGGTDDYRTRALLDLYAQMQGIGSVTTTKGKKQKQIYPSNKATALAQSYMSNVSDERGFTADERNDLNAVIARLVKTAELQGHSGTASVSVKAGDTAGTVKIELTVKDMHGKKETFTGESVASGDEKAFNTTFEIGKGIEKTGL